MGVKWLLVLYKPLLIGLKQTINKYGEQIHNHFPHNFGSSYKYPNHYEVNILIFK